ncbi:MAG: amino acid permease [Saprospiraceae bacterium]|nr:amino acid permease [Saprospiraceae bacterium]
MSQLKKDLTITSLTMIVIGSCIGSGIFVTPAGTFKQVPHHGYVLLTWLLGGLVTFFGAMTFSELSARFPKAGGVYVFLKEAYGSLAGFLYGWIILLIVTTGALAALSVVFTDYLGYFLDINETERLIIAIFTITLLTGVNVIGVNISGMFAKLFTGLKLIALLAIIILGIVYFDTDATTHAINFDFTEFPDDLGSMMLLAFVGVFFSFGGWHHATYLSGEIKNPQSTVPRAMLLGTLTVTLVYILTIFAYSSLLPMDEIINSERVAGDAVGNIIKGGGKLVAIGITISIFGTIGIYTMSAPRIYYAMAKDGIFFKSLAKIHPKYKTPYIAMLFQCGWAVLLIILFKNFHSLMTFATFMDIIFMALATSTIFIFRNRKGQEVPAFKLRFYPVIPALYLLVTVAFVINLLLQLEGVPIIALIILFLGIPAYIYFKKGNDSKMN